MPTHGRSLIVGSWFDDGDDFEAILDEAEDKAVTTWEMQFVDEVRRRWEQYGMRSFMSEAQYESLKRIAEK